MNKKHLIIGVIIIGLLGIGYLFFGGREETELKGYVSLDNQTRDSFFQTYDFFASSSVSVLPTTLATTTTATSTNITPYYDHLGRYDEGYFIIAGAERVSFLFQRGDLTGVGNTGTSTFSIEVTEDGSTWHDYNKLVDNVTNTNAQQLTRVSSVQYSAAANVDTATSTKWYSMSLEDSFYAARCIVVVELDGESTCSANASW